MGLELELNDSSPNLTDFKVPRADPEKDWIQNFQAELDAYRKQLRVLNAMEPTQVFQTLSSVSARVSEMRSQLLRIDSNRCTSFRTRQVDPLLEEVERQFKIHSRIQSIRDLEWRVGTKEF